MALPHAKPGEIVDLSPLGTAFADARTSALMKTEEFEAIRLVVPAGIDIPEHDVPGSITLQCLEGRVLLGLRSTTLELGPHRWVYLDGGVSHSIRGLEDSSLLLTIFFPQSRPAATE